MYHCLLNKRENTLFSGLLFLVMILSVNADEPKPPVPNGRRLREIVAEKYPKGNVYVGGTTGWKKRPMGSGVIVDREFNYVCPENDYKQSTVHPKPGVWNWELGDAWVEHCKKTKQVIRIHGPISPQSSKWAKDDGRTADELRTNMIEFMTALCKRYDTVEHVKWMDVVNETVQRNGSWFGPKKGTDKWENPWPKLGYDDTHPLKPPLYIKMAFEIATKHAPNTKLVINQHGGMEVAMWKTVKALVPYLRKHGLRVDGIGWQAHIDTGWETKPGNMERLHELIDWAHTNKLSFHVTEMNAWLKGKNKDYDRQAKTFGAIMQAILEHRENGLVTWNVWNVSDNLAWKENREKDGTLFDHQFKAKPGYYALQKLLENPPVARPPRTRE